MATRTYHKRYPKQIVVLTDEETKARLERLAREWRRSRSEVTRLAVEAGLRVIDPEGEDVEEG